MHVCITGGTGLIGRALSKALRERGDEVTIVTRSPSVPDEIGWDVHVPGSLELPEGTTHVVHLAGAPLVTHRWNTPHKREIIESRVKGTERVVEGVRAHGNVEHVVSASAVGYYSDKGDDTLTEDDPPGNDFLSHVCTSWEDASLPIRKDDTLDTRLTWIRSGTVLSTEGGGLAEMLNPLPGIKPFHWGLGGPVGGGEQWFPWIHIQDEVGAILHLLDQGLEGPFNLTAPGLCRNRDFVKAIGHALDRPAFIPVPEAALKAIYGESAKVIIQSLRVTPKHLEESGYTFQHPNIQEALHDLLA